MPARSASNSTPASTAAKTKAQAKGKALETKNPAESHAVWTFEDETALIAFLLDYKAEGNEINSMTWKAAAKAMENHMEKGGTKGPGACKTKWARLKQTYYVVRKLMEQSEFSWSSERGADIEPGSEEIWRAYVKQHPKAAPFFTKGWPHYEDIQQLMQTTVDGVNSFYASEAPSPDRLDHVGGKHGDDDEEEEEEEISDKMICDGDEDSEEVALTAPATLLSPRSHLLKRKYSALATPTATSFSNPSSSTASSTSSGRRKHQTSTTAAINALLMTVCEFVSSLKENNSSGEEPLFKRKRLAMLRAQEVELDLEDDQLVTLLNLFQTDVNAADVYMVIKRESLRKKWVQMKLARK